MTTVVSVNQSIDKLMWQAYTESCIIFLLQIRCNFFLLYCSCWVSFTNNLIWTFVTPVLLVCVVSFYILYQGFLHPTFRGAKTPLFEFNIFDTYCWLWSRITLYHTLLFLWWLYPIQRNEWIITYNTLYISNARCRGWNLLLLRTQNERDWTISWRPDLLLSRFFILVLFILMYKRYNIWNINFKWADES